MKYNKQLELKNGKELTLRNGTEADALDLIKIFNQTHEETDFLRTYPDENNLTEEDEGAFLKGLEESSNAIEILAFVDGQAVGSAGIDPIGNKFKEKHRADFGISVIKEYWGMGIGRALASACIDCAKEAGYTQLELTAVADNANALALYSSLGYVEFGRNPRGFNSRISGYQEIVHMRLEL